MRFADKTLLSSRTERLENKVALITGGTRGIGLAIAQALINERCKVVVTSRNPELRQLTRAGLKLRGNATTLACDVRDLRSVEALFGSIKKRYRHIDILINNAGIAHPNLTADKLPINTWRDVIETNLNGMFLVTHYALPLMRRGGAIVNNLSIAAKRVFSGTSAYNASKHGALGFTNTLREELRSRGIRVIALLPGATDTDIWQSLWPEAPRKKMLNPQTVADAVVRTLTLPPESTVEELVIMPAAGTL